MKFLCAAAGRLAAERSDYTIKHNREYYRVSNKY
jgi:hypothetical protein